MLKRWSTVLVVLVAVALAAGCASQKAPAEAAVSAAEQAFAAAKDEAAKYLPDQVKGVQDALDAAKASLAKGDYQAALTAAQALPARTSELTTAAAAKKAELTQSWATLSAGLPQVVLPSGFRQDGTPVSITFCGGLYGEGPALQLARAYQEATGWHRRTPSAFGPGASPPATEAFLTQKKND